jgi:hypothetical protein
LSVSAAVAEDAQVSAFSERLRTEPSKTLSDNSHVSAFENPEDFCPFQPKRRLKALTFSYLNTFEQDEHLRFWGEVEEERAAIVVFDGNIPRSWAEGFARLSVDQPPGNVSPTRWQRYVDDVGLFLDGSFCAIAAALGWGPFELFGCDRDRTFFRIDQAGLLWLLNGSEVVALSGNTATILTPTGARQTWRRIPSQPGRILTWELVR